MSVQRFNAAFNTKARAYTIGSGT